MNNDNGQKIIIECKNLCKNYKIGNSKLEILKDLNWSVEEGSWSAILGASGSGKTTFLNMIGALERPSSGDIIIDGANVNKLSPKAASLFRNKKIGFIFQSYQLLGELTVLENIMLPGLLANLSKKECQAQAKKLAEEVGLGARLKHHPSEMSGGEQQRCAIARALINQPAIILADEPTGNLDKNTGNEILDLFKNLQQSNKRRTIIMITHSEVVAKSASQVYLLDNGVLV